MHIGPKLNSYRLVIATHRKHNADAITPIIKKACSNWLVLCGGTSITCQQLHYEGGKVNFTVSLCSGSNASQCLHTEAQRVAEVGGRENNVSLDDVTCHPHGSLTKGDSNYSVSLCSTFRARSLAERGERDGALAHTLQLVPG